jgi:hypothetical protein
MKRVLVLSGLIAASLGLGVTAHADACGTARPQGCAKVPPAPVSPRAGGPTLSVTCGLPSAREIVTCSVSGRGFHPTERLALTYHVTFTALPRQHGRFPQSVYHRAGLTDAHGRFVRPPLRFAVVRYHEAYRLTVLVTGSAGDRAGRTLVAVAQ